MSETGKHIDKRQVLCEISLLVTASWATLAEHWQETANEVGEIVPISLINGRSIFFQVVYELIMHISFPLQ